MRKFFIHLLQFAEVFDAWRIAPRLMVTVYSLLVYKLYSWYKTLSPVERIECDDVLVRSLVELGMNVNNALETSCTVVGFVGGPTTEQTAFVTAIIGLATAIFAFYVNTGRAWSKGSSLYPDTIQPAEDEDSSGGGRDGGGRGRR